MIEMDIHNLTLDEITNPHFIESLFDTYKDNENERNNVLCEVVELAKQHNVDNKVRKEIDKCNRYLKNTNNVTNNNVNILLSLDSKGEAEPTVENYLSIMSNDTMIKDLFVYDVFSNKVLCKDKGGFRTWDDMDDSSLKAYIEKNYGIYNQLKYYDAFNTILRERTFHPIKNIIEANEWDNIPRIDNFLTDILKCPKDDYHREVSRMIFYGGISRLYNPGCKFDYMPILIGEQGSGKSSIINWLALEDKFYTDVPSIEGKDALEQLQGRWICEFAELLAMVRTKDVEAMKSFVTRTTDKYRQSYGRRTMEFPRQCIFIGTTNDHNFLVDKTGNRRYLPVELGLKMGELFEKEMFVKNYILECWREALVLFKNHKTYLTIPGKYYDKIKSAQEYVMEDDPKVGLIEAYLNDKKIGDKVCGLEIFTKCLNEIKKNYGRSEAKEITRYMSYNKNWKRCEKPNRFNDYGVQRCWEKIDPDSKWSDLD